MQRLLIALVSCTLLAYPIDDDVKTKDASPAEVAAPSPKTPEALDVKPAWRDPGDCGRQSLYALMHLEGHNAVFADVSKTLVFDAKVGCSLADVARAAEALGFPVEVRFVNPRDLPSLPFPYIMHTAGSLQRGTGHFVLIVGHSPNDHTYSVMDTDQETVRPQSERSLLLGFTGYVLLPKSSVRATWSGVTSWLLLGMGAAFAGAAFLRHFFHKSPLSKSAPAASTIS